ncbi:hypothetical protein IWQ60_007513 [Tieghemiomyces parasiticus]|uniref:Transketolase-like pyrimidine-binding domain-containing protein n=1 Tax=Tieghemiomyces parasiticus TaxID=78921 RepID=A0A9W8DU42_9FUNG|nr:hypothetical protein IWQ60_007513 [Tieghemiomyces parasiticus]
MPIPRVLCSLRTVRPGRLPGALSSTRTPRPLLTKGGASGPVWAGRAQRLPTLTAPHRAYHDEGAHGYRRPEPSQLTDFTEAEIANRIQHSQLVRLVAAFRDHGHKAADLDPLGMAHHANVPELEPARYGLQDLGAVFPLLGIVHINRGPETTEPLAEASLETILDHLRQVYCAQIAFEFNHIPDSAERRWLAHMAESFHREPFQPDQKRRVFELLARSEVFDHFMQKKFGQVKRYGLEGAESMMVALDQLFDASSARGVEQVVMCMAHRGRLNLLTDLLQMSPTVLFHKVQGNSEFPAGLPATGDVLSHLTHTPDLDYGTGRSLHVTMLPNPSHLEAVNPVAMGKARAKQMDRFAALGDEDAGCQLGDRVLCLQLHGDAAWTGQGVVMEGLGLSNLPHFTSGGSVHLIVNNQLGYTTPALNARSTLYTSDIGKMVNAPLIHVNGDHPEEVARAALLALRYRAVFKKDVILDLLTFRRWGHNELDEPAFTQPQMYRTIRARTSVPQLYERKLLAEPHPVVTPASIGAFRDDYFAKLSEHLRAAADYVPPPVVLKGKWAGLTVPHSIEEPATTGVDGDILRAIGKASVTYPAGMTVHPRLLKYHVTARLNKLVEGTRLDWATAEMLAIGSLLREGHNVRLSGQDVGRGTFSQRHAMLVCQDTERVYIPINHQADGDPQVAKPGRLEVANSHLSELAVLGFEYGMSLENPHNLVMWEAQYGDFYNTAQVIVDTFIASGNTKWLRQTGLVMLLPHGYDGTGPEHSSCRLERFLQLSNDPIHFDVTSGAGESYALAEGHQGRLNPNLHVVNCTTPAQYFHVLRRQLKRNYRKPLIIATPKTLLKSPLAVSSLDDLVPNTRFQPVLPDPRFMTSRDPADVRRIVFVSGRLYYDLVKHRAEVGQDDTVALVRLEELCPFPRDQLRAELARFPNAQEFTWCQEETENSGAYAFALPRLQALLPAGTHLRYVGRPPLAACVTGIASVYREEQAKLICQAFE